MESGELTHFRCDGLGGAGEEFQRRIALVLLQRATLRNRPFKLAFEMTAAGKFDDVGLFLEPSTEWWLIQAKHSEAGGCLTGEMLLPGDEVARKRGNFSLFKYLESFCEVRDYWPHGGGGTWFVIFTNKELDSLVDSDSVDGVDRLFKFTVGGEHRRLKPSEETIDLLEQYVNRDFESICCAIKELFSGGEMKHILKSYKTPLMQIFSLHDGVVKFADNILENNKDPRVCRLYTRLAEEFEPLDMASISIESAKMKDFWIGNSRNKLLPPSIDRATVGRFFDELILAISQPNVDKLLEEINGDWRLWMRSWIRPDDLGRFSSSQLEQPFNSFKKSFQEWEKSTTATKERSFLELEDGQRFLKNVERDLGDFVRNCSKRSCTSFVDVERFFIHRQIEVVKEQMGTGIDEYALFYNNIKDTDFVDQLYTTFVHQRRFVLVAEPGMGKSILWQYLAFYAQQIYPESAVFLLYMNNFNHQLPPAETLDDVMNVLETDLSAESLGLFRNENTKILLFLDAFDELSRVNLERVLNYITILLHRDNLKILINTRRRVQEMLEKTLDIKAMKLERFDERNQLDFLHKFWHVADSDRAKFEQFAGNLLDKFHRDIQRRKYDFTGLPLMIKMLAEIYSQSYETIAQSDGERVESLEPITVVDLYEKFTKKCIHLTISKKLNIDTERFVPYFEEITQICGRDYQLAAIYKVLPANLLSKVVDKTFSSRLKMFIHKIVDDETLLIELVAGTPQFIHLSYAEYFCATYLYNFLNSSPNLPCVETFTTFLDNHDVIRNFFLAMINEKPTDNHLNFLRKIGDRAAFWSCQGDFITLVNFLKQFYNYRKIRQTIPDWYDNEADELTRQCCQLGGDILGPSLLHLAVEYNALDTLDVLFESRIDVNIRDHKKATPLHYACSSGNLRIVEQLLDRGAKVRTVDGNGYTGLHIAAYEGHLGIVRCLMDHGAKVEGVSRFGETARMLAEKQKHAEIVALLDSKT
ncbi:uncharacterized protein LOC6032102 [Culex quinquefasciatus]|uniref:uncharacterized protein LOC6032102 n=1 Tax=Culex quinquefasciatus TaxID=7176 RepID=UPI0018E335C4|nr:uncharacterized protein LOC6032102 [Culex quinquefasciatus]